MMDWDDLRYFVKVAETGSLLSAAKFLQVNVATVGRHIERLEAQLGRKLFRRTQQGYRLTDDGARMAQWAQRVQDEVANLHALFAAESDRPKGPVSIATTEPLSQGFLAPVLSRLSAKLPEVVYELVSDLRPVNLSRREADILLRLGRVADGNLLARRIGEVAYDFYASPAYLKKHGTPRRGDGFAGHRIVEWPSDWEPSEQILWQRRIAAYAVPALRTASAYMRVAVARGGLAIALLPCMLVDARSGLRRIETGARPPMPEIWLASHAGLAHQPAIRATLDLIAAAARSERPRLRGEH